MSSIVAVYVGLAILAPLCALAERTAPATTVTSPIAPSRRLDWLYWIVTPLGTGLLTRMATLGAAALVATALGWRIADANDVLACFHERSPLRDVPFPAQIALALVLADFVSYWSHRLRHRAGFFPLHAVHHAPETLDWLAAARMHPLDDLADNVAVTLPILVLGFDPWIFVALGPALLLHTLYLHANVRLSLGPLRYVVASPDFHRWHHAASASAQGANFGGVLSIWDVAFGTFRMPPERPDRLGLEETDALPESLGAQLAIPVARVLTAGRGGRRPRPRPR